MGYIGSKPANKVITASDLEDDIITSAKIADGVIVAGDLAANSVDSSELIDGSIDTSHIDALQVTTAKIAADAIDGTKLADNAVESEHMAAGSVDNAHLAGSIATSKIGSGTFADARISESSVTQHVTAFDDTDLRSDIITLALKEAITENRVAYNLPNSMIEQFQDDSKLGTETDGDRNASEYWGTTQATTGQYSNDANTMLLLHMDDTSLIDSSSNAHTTTLNGGMGRSATQAKFGSYSAFFDGTDDWIGLPQHSDFAHGTGDFTWEAWVWIASDNQSNSQIFNHGGSGANHPGWGFQSSFDPYIYAAGYYGDSAVVTHSTWTHVAVVRSSGALYLFKGGVLQGSSVSFTNNLTTPPSGFPMIGAYNDPDTQHFKGYYDEIRISNTARWTATFTPQDVVSGSATGTLISTANTANASQTKVSGVILYANASGTATLGTDLKIYFTCNGGTNWTESTPTAAGTFSSGILMAKCPEVTCTAGTDIRYKAVWANQADGSKETRLHGIGMNY